MKDVSVVEGYEQTSKYLSSLQAAADMHREALGFLPTAVYLESARSGDLLVLVDKSDGAATYAGHLLFSSRFPRAHIRQMLVLPMHRKRGNALLLLRHLEQSLVKQGFIAIYARVAEDLREANAFWERQSFYVQRAEQGGATRNRQILIRTRELPSPQLFASSGMSVDNPLGLSHSASKDAPLFLLDMNVLFDVMPRRLRHDSAASLFQAERVNACRLAISEESRNELRRTATQTRTDPMVAFISMLPSFPLAGGAANLALLETLAALVFPEQELTESDKSDLRHLATAIVNELTGFITNDETILNSAGVLRTKFGIQVMSPDVLKIDMALTGNGRSFSTSPEATLRLSAVSAVDEPIVQKMLIGVGVPRDKVPTVWLPSEVQGKFSARVSVWRDKCALGYLNWAARYLDLTPEFSPVRE